MTVVSVQAFGITAPGGGPRILRALFDDAPLPVVSVCTTTSPPPPADPFAELWRPARPAFGRLEATRAGGPLGTLETVLAGRLERQIAAACREHGATAVHAVAHASDFWPALRAAERAGLPFVLTVHDDPRYVLRSRPELALVLRRLGDAWRRADRRFVIGALLGEEYCARYGEAEYSVVTDGLADEDIAAEPVRPGGLRVYFAGLFHRAYTDNVRPFAAGLAEAGAARGVAPGLRLRCGVLPAELDAAELGATVMPFGPEEVVARDIAAADFVYMPLPFGAEYRDFFRFSLSTKMVTYLGCGRPIVYHGPAEGAAYEILARHDAAIFVHSLEPDAIRDALVAGAERSRDIAANALALARRDFRIADQRERFWSAFTRAGERAAAVA